MKHISFDLETWGTEPGHDGRSIGAVVFDPLTGHIDTTQTFYIAVDNPPLYDYTDAKIEEWEKVRQFNLTRDPKTVQWWSEQTAEAQAAFEDPERLDLALSAFTSWLWEIAPQEHGHPDGWPSVDLRMWSHGANFDPGIIGAWYRACGLPNPVHYRSPRDTRTIFEAAGMDPATCLDGFKGEGVHHHALDDAMTQARAICAAYQRLREPEQRLTAAIREARRQIDDGQQNAAFYNLGVAIGVNAPGEP